MQKALNEMEGIIGQRYPTATFEVSRGEDDPEAVHLTATVDLDDPDQVLDLVITRVMELQADEGLPLHVIPVRTPERAAALRQALTETKQHRRFQNPPPSP
jgi:hypothetical protein